MCKANGKLWNDFWRTDRCSQYLEALSGVTGNPVTGHDGLVQSRQGGADQGTWVHPDVATELARWISPSFSVFVNQWFRDEFERRAAPENGTRTQVVPVLSPQESLDLIERSMGLLQRLGVLDQRDQLQFGDMVRNVAARGAGGLLLPASDEEQELTLSDAWLEVTGMPLPTKKASGIGKIVAAYYRQEFEQDPPKRWQHVDGAPRLVNSYKRGWLVKAVKSAWDQIRERSGLTYS